MKKGKVSSPAGFPAELSKGTLAGSSEKSTVKSLVKKAVGFVIRILASAAIILVVNLIFRGNFISAITLDPASNVSK
ncbi:MAG TPA: hypothetical protein GXX37_00535 [Clostridiaceae bacterium]|nr:hypothetical protein [Clostridiaceae bacterium]